ncbi:TPA: hypothetical protein N0F65_005392 [Lagenidium giganteum]|uniref:EGF-like domain-containing protein n=1 Tax=Lagenidium giganteum TaxID=4803 RepID=A0AAV2YZL9_9STRA|nr:TPA: hypothetical protein N0F65_005392 [Lagenidium giganteum]
MAALRQTLRQLWHGSKSDKAKRQLPAVLLRDDKEKESLRKEERLADVMWRPEEEFPGRTKIDQSLLTFHREAQVLARIAKTSAKRILEPMRLALLGTCSLSVVGITSYEAHLLTDPACAASDALLFMYKYSAENFFASCIWETREPEIVARAVGFAPEDVLAVINPETKEGASLQLRLLGTYTMRSIVAGFMVITQLLSIVRESMLSAFAYQDHVYAGKEPPLDGIQERIIRLAGDGSDVTEVSMARYGAHILPVYESPAKFRHLVAHWSLNGRVPCVWRVAAGHYGYRHSWAQLAIDSTYMLRTTTGKYILCIEADATNLDRAHDLQKPNNDITLEDASQAYRMIERAAARKLQRPFRSLCVFLGDSRQLCDTGGTAFVTIRERIRLKKEVDVLIDAKAPLLLAILKWCERFVGKRKMVVLDATPLNYAPLELLLTRNGYTVLDPSKTNQGRHAGVPPEKNAEKTEPLPRLIYYPTTAATINAVHATLTEGIADPRHCCVLINSPFGLSHLQEIAELEGEHFHPICAAEIYDDYFRQVRIWTRMGHSPAVIQRELDLRFARVFNVQQEIAQLQRASTTMKKLPCLLGRERNLNGESHRGINFLEFCFPDRELPQKGCLLTAHVLAMRSRCALICVLVLGLLSVLAPDGYMGYDCLDRTCPRRKAWGVITGNNLAHEPRECAGRGICNRATGQCVCQLGFHGDGCQYTDCPDSCLAHGKCVSMNAYAQIDMVARELNNAPPYPYDQIWDNDMINGCTCDAGYYSPNCAQKTCPRGDDPLTTGQVDAVQLVQCQTTYQQQTIQLNFDQPMLQGTFLLSFGSQYTRPISFLAPAVLDTVATSMTTTLLKLQGMTSVTVTRQDSPNQITWQVTFPITNPSQNALSPRWKVIEVQQFFCAADAGVFSLSMGNETVSSIPYNVDATTFQSKLATLSFYGRIDVTFTGAATVCSSTGTYVTLAFKQLWSRLYFGDLPPMRFSSRDVKNLPSLLLNSLEGFIDSESKELIKGIDTCRVVEIQQFLCAATSGAFTLTFEDGSKVTSIQFDSSAANLRSLILSKVAFIVDLDVTYSTGLTACSDLGTTITLSFVVVRIVGAKADGDLAEVVSDATNGGSNGLNHISNRLIFPTALTEIQKGATCVALDQTYAANPGRQMQAPLVAGGGTFTLSFRGSTSAPIPARATPQHVKDILERMPTIQGVNVSYTGAQACQTPANVMSITFTQNFGSMPTMTADGSMLVPGSTVAVAGPGGGFVALSPIVSTKESDVCSNRGLCDETKLGRCYCYLGYTNSNGRGQIGNLLVNRGDCGAISRIPVACPGDLACSGHGVCSGSPSYRCTCAKGWRSGDCSERTCSMGLAWFDYPVGPNVAHSRMVECSGVGSCDRSTGLCKCPRPYTGTACELMSCGGSPSECSGNGRCLTLSILAPLVTVKGERAGYIYGDDPNNPVTWDRNKIRSCLCDPRFTGYDCSLYECPRGDDPYTSGDTIEKQLLQCVATSGTLVLSFRDAATPPLPYDVDAPTLQAALQALPTIGDVRVTYMGGTTACSTNNVLIIVELLTALGDLPPIRATNSVLRNSVSGNGLDGSGSVTVATGGTTLLGQTSVAGTREDAYCSNHGKCDFTSGTCVCDPQWSSSDGKGGPGTIGDCGYHHTPRKVD